MSGQTRSQPLARGHSPLPAAVYDYVIAGGLAGMAYAHIRDVGDKIEEHVEYMAALFFANIALSLLLIVALFALPGRRMEVYAAAASLAALTIAGFMWSRTIGFPQMEDHVGQWDALGLASVAFEALVVVASFLAVQARARGATR
jgi:hypothetical protein